MSSIVKQALDKYAGAASKVWSHERINTVGASEVGQCIRKTYWLKSENDSRYKVDRDPDYQETWGARMRGTIYEACFWEPAMRAMFGKRLHYAGAEQRTFVTDYLSATPDGMIYRLTKTESANLGIDGNCVMVECKTADPRTELKSPKQVNVFQTQVQMGMVREHTPYAPKHSVLSYTDASFWHEVKEFVISFDPDLYDIAKERAMTIMTATDLSQLPPEGWIAGGSECRYCPFTIACGIERRNLPFQDDVDVDPQFAAEMRDMALSLRTLESSRDGMDSDVRSLQDAIKSRLREKGVKKIPGVLTWSPVKGRSGYDNKLIKQAAVDAGIDVEKFKTQGEPTDRLVITIDQQELVDTDAGIRPRQTAKEDL